MESLPARVLKALRKVLPDPAKTYPLHEPEFSGNEWKYVKECIDSRMVSSVGSYVDRFEKMLEEYTGAKHAVAVVNGTAGLHIALKLAGVQSGDEVLVPALTFVASANAVTYCGATPHFVDSEEDTLGMDPDKLAEYLRNHMEQRSGVCFHRKTGKVVRAMLPMHTFGHPVRLEELMRVARDFRIALVEDAAESIGSLYYGKHTGTFGLMGVLSFNGNKTITTGGGGAILTNDVELAKRAKHLTTTAKLAHPWDYRHDEIGYNYRLVNLNAALGCAQLEQLPVFLKAKRTLFKLYQNVFREIADVNLFCQPVRCQSNFWLQTLVLKCGRERQLEPTLAKLHKEKILVRPAWAPLHQLNPFRSFPRMDLQITENLAQRILNLPSSPSLADALR
ncbi:MAG: LegC family aminotransferase [Bacteroidetes bacterium]|nr:LegC family aminotransferase [Bacteroidota bacterium]